MTPPRHRAVVLYYYFYYSYYFLAHEHEAVGTKYWSLRKVNNWLHQASRLWTCSETRPRFPFARPLITAGTGRWSLWSLLWLWSPAFSVPGPAQLHCLVVPDTGCFNTHWSEDVSCRQLAAFVGLVGGGKVGCSSCLLTWASAYVSRHVCDVPCQRLSLLQPVIYLS